VGYFDVKIVVGDIERMTSGSTGAVTDGELAAWEDRGIEGSSLLPVDGFGEAGFVDGF
jgi:hypothetical protein